MPRVGRCCNRFAFGTRQPFGDDRSISFERMPLLTRLITLPEPFSQRINARALLESSETRCPKQHHLGDQLQSPLKATLQPV